MLQSDAHESFPRLAFGRRVTIQVCDSQGKPVGDARIVVHPDTQPVSTRSGEALLEVTSGSDGRAVVLTGIDGLAAETCQLTVYPPRRDSPVSVQRRTDREEWTIRLDHAQAQPPTQLDLALIIDTTGSMSDELEYLKVEIEAIARSVREMFPHVDRWIMLAALVMGVLICDVVAARRS